MKKNKAFIELKRIEAARVIAKTLSSSRNRVFLDANTLMLNLVEPVNEKLMNIGEEEGK